MNSSELRLGNLVMYDTGEIGAVVALTEYEIAITQDRELIHQDCYSGIPITPERLERLGFEPYETNIYGTMFVGYLSPEFCGLQLNLRVRENEYYIRYEGKEIRVYEIHQLQNLTQLLTGNELTIK